MRRISHLVFLTSLLFAGTALAQLQPLPSGPSASPAGGRPLWVTQELNSRQRYLSDERFITEAATANIAALEMGRLAMERASNPQVRDYARQEVRDRTRADRDLRKLAGSRTIMMPALPNREDQRELGRLQAKSGKDFDRSYVKTMRRDQDERLALYSNASKSNSLDPQLRGYAGDKLSMVETSQREAHSLQVSKHNDEPSQGINEGFSAQSFSPTPGDE